MTTYKRIQEQKLLIARAEQSLALEKLKKRRADTRRKIELGGLVIKSGMNNYNESVILGALDYALKLITQDKKYQTIYETIGEGLFKL